MRKSMVGVVGLVAGLSACTTYLETSKAKPNNGISKGYSYQLPRLGYDTKITRKLIACPENSTQSVRFEITAAAVPALSRGEIIVVDYLAASSGMKTTEFVLKSHPNGMLKSINLTVDDRTADIVKEGVKSIVGIAKIAIGLPSDGMVANGKIVGDKMYLRCSKSASDTLAALPKLKKTLKDAETGVEDAEKSLNDLTSASKIGKPAKAEKVAELTKAVRLKIEVREQAKKEYENAIKSLTIVQNASIQLPDAGVEHVFKLTDIKDSEVKPNSLFEIYKPTSNTRSFNIPLNANLMPDIDNATPTGYPNGALGEIDVEADRAKLKADVKKAESNMQASPYAGILVHLGNADATFVAFGLGADSGEISIPAAKSCSEDKNDCGVVYRSPLPGRVRICEGSDSSGCKSLLTGDSTILFHEERFVPQFGQLISLPLKNGPFTNNSLSAEFSEDGQILEMSYKKPTAEVLAATSSLNDGIGGVTELITYKNGQELRKLKDQQTLYEAQLNTQEARDKLSPSELDKLKNDKEIIDAQIALAESQKRSQAQPTQVTQVENQTLLLEAQTKQIQALIDLRKAERELSELDSSPADAQ